MRTEEQNNSLKEERKNNIVISALKVFCKKGYDGTTVDDITKKADCSHGLFYHYFKSKKQLFDEVMNIKHTENENEMKKVFYATDNYLEKLRIVINGMFSQLKNNENFSYYFYFLISQLFSHKDSDKKPFNKSDEKRPEPPIVFFTRLFREGQEKGFFAKSYSAEECARLFISIIQGATLVYVISPKEMQNKFAPLPNIDFIIDIFKNKE